MIKLINKVRGFAQEQSGATAIEYGLIAAGIAVVLIGLLVAVSGGLTNTFTAITTALGG